MKSHCIVPLTMLNSLIINLMEHTLPQIEHKNQEKCRKRILTLLFFADNESFLSSAKNNKIGHFNGSRVAIQKEVLSELM